MISHSLEFCFFININILFCFNADTWLHRTRHVLAKGASTDLLFLPTVPIHCLTICSVISAICCYVTNYHKPNSLKQLKLISISTGRNLGTAELGPLLRVSQDFGQGVGWSVFLSEAQGHLPVSQGCWQNCCLQLQDWSSCFLAGCQLGVCSQLQEAACSSPLLALSQHGSWLQGQQVMFPSPLRWSHNVT